MSTLSYFVFRCYLWPPKLRGAMMLGPVSLVLGLPQGHGTSSLGHGPSASPSSSSPSPSPLALAPENTRVLRGDWLAVYIGKDIFSVESYGAKGATLAWITIWLSTHTTICAIHCRRRLDRRHPVHPEGDRCVRAQWRRSQISSSQGIPLALPED